MKLGTHFLAGVGKYGERWGIRIAPFSGVDYSRVAAAVDSGGSMHNLPTWLVSCWSSTVNMRVRRRRRLTRTNHASLRGV